MVEEFARQFEENAAIPTQRSLDAMRGKLDASDRLRQIDFGLVVPEGWARMELPLAPCAAAPAGDIRDPDRLAAHRLGLLAELEERIVKENLNVYICLDTEGIREHLIAEIGDRGMRIIVQPLSEGFEITALNTVVLSQSDLYGRYKRHAVRRPTARETAASAGERLTSLDHISAGDLVVHVEHGIGRYVGVTELEFDGRRSEMLTIEYAGNSKLHVPIGQAHLLSRYIGTGESVRLHALGGRRWSAEKDAAEKSVADMAAAMLETQARRAHLPGHAYAAETPWLHEFEASFPYTETDDQANCVTDVKRDMYSTHPMDRLICGDAGYGKTEVAMRAAFIAAMQGRQVAVLVPTTVLAQQHYDTFRERMAPYPIMIGVHSRFCTVTQRARVLQQVADGKLDIVIGTHGLLRPSVKFKDLGLVIIDEEQRFGVGHKEHFKRMRALVDVLTLSATPIPRTLQMGLTGVRDLSLLQTPPQERVATETRVVSDGDEVVRLAIERELDRGGQVFYLYNRVLTIDRMRERITRLVPRASIGVGHGQMPAKQIEDTMLRFTRGELDILLCTTIIESGVDIPRANTILIDRADRFGIADLYQLRGRVGRAARKGYALLLVPDSGVLDADARERLKALRQHSGTGAAFQLALRDLGIRGAGNLLGAAQSGHIAAVGFMLYCQLLRRSVAQLRGEKPPLLVNVSLRMDLLDFAPGQMDAGGAVCLPYGYVDDESQRISLYRRLAECASQVEVDAIGQELADRFGRPPQAALRLLTVTGLRIRAAAAGIQRIEVREGEVSLFRDGVPVRIKGKLPVITTRSADAQLAALRRMLGQR
jgi:transcription-repair coupling factor (superfamily II helicase)